MDYLDCIITDYADGKRCIVICSTDSQRAYIATALNREASKRKLCKNKGTKTHVNKDEKSQLSNLESRRLTLWKMRSVYDKSRLQKICTLKYDILYCLGLKDTELKYALSTVALNCSSYKAYQLTVEDSCEDSDSYSSIEFIVDDSSTTSSESDREERPIFEENYRVADNRSVVLVRPNIKPTQETMDSILSKISCTNITVEQTTVHNVPRVATKYIKLYSPGSTVVALTSLNTGLSSSTVNEEHTYYKESISRLNRGRIYEWKKDTLEKSDCLFVCSKENVRPLGKYEQLIYIVDDPARCRSNYSKKFADQLYNSLLTVFTLNVKRMVVICNEFYSGQYSLNTSVQYHPVHDIIKKYGTKVVLSDSVYSKYEIPCRCTASEYLKMKNLKYSSVPLSMSHTKNIESTVERLVYSLECPYDEDAALNRWQSIDANIADTYYSTDGLLVDFKIEYKSSAGYIYCTDIANLLVAMQHFGLRTNGILVSESQIWLVSRVNDELYSRTVHE